MNRMIRYVHSILIAGLVALAPPLAGAKELVAEFKGSISRTTPEFEVEAPWILDWRVTSTNRALLAVDVALERAGIGVHEGSVLRTKQTGNGVRLFNESGTFYFRVNSSMANWVLRVEELTEEEAGLYTPKEPGQEP